MTNEEKICKKLAGFYAGKNWSEVSTQDRDLISDLEQAGWIELRDDYGLLIGREQNPSRNPPKSRPEEDHKPNTIRI